MSIRRLTRSRDARIILRTVLYTLCGLFVVVGITSDSASTAVLGVTNAGVLALLFNEGRVRSRLPLLGGPGRAARAMGWLLVFILYVAINAAVPA